MRESGRWTLGNPAECELCGKTNGEVRLSREGMPITAKGTGQCEDFCISPACLIFSELRLACSGWFMAIFTQLSFFNVAIFLVECGQTTEVRGLVPLATLIPTYD